MTDIDIANSIEIENIKNVAKKLGIQDDEIICYGNDKAKIIKKSTDKKGKLILVTAINPTPYGEGKTTVSIGLGDAFNKLKKNVVVALREPSMGPVFGMKGGATGGGYSQIIPMEDINLHFTGDIHAITSANNLLASAIDNHIYNGNELDIRKVLFNRCLDINDRSLRNISYNNQVMHFDITAASEIMAILTLATDINDLKERLGKIIVGLNSDNEYIYAKQLNIVGSLAAILKYAMYPNLVQTLEHTPVLVHGGPFANIAHGCSSIVSSKLAMSIADYTITEAGFGSDLGAEKFFDIVCRSANFKPDCIVLVATVKALKYNGEGDLEKGLVNLVAHINNLKENNSNVVVCINKYNTDTLDELNIIKRCCEDENVSFAVSTAYKDGGSGAISLANMVLESIKEENNFSYLYDVEDSIKNKIKSLATKIYHADKVLYTKEAEDKINKVTDFKMPICVAKTQYSLSDDKNKLGAPSGYDMVVRDIKVYNGAGFITVYLGNILTMPGLSKHPNYENINLEEEKIIGIT